MSTTRPVCQDTCEQAIELRVAARPRRRSPRTAPTRTRTPRRSRAAASGASRPGCSSSLVSTSSPGPELQAADHGVHAVGGRRRSARPRPASRPAAPPTRSRSRLAELRPGARTRLAARPPSAWARSSSIAASAAGARASAPPTGVQVGQPLEHRELRSAGAADTRRILGLGAMIVERSMQSPTGCPTPTSWPTSPAGTAVIIDSGGPSGPLLETIEEHGPHGRRTCC